jgi:hypothetical protein
LPGDLYISSSCVISNYSIRKDGVLLFQQTGMGIQDFLAAAYKALALEYPKFYKMDTLSKLGWLAAELLLKGFDRQAYSAENLGVVLSNSNASLDTDRRYFDTVKTFASPALFVYTLPNIVIGEICIRHDLKGENGFFVFDQFDPNFVQQYVSGLINNNILQACICGWVDVLKEDHKAALFLVEKSKRTESTFTAENLKKIFNDRQDNA